MENRKWIVLNYNLPTEPSRPRVAVWRKLKKLGAVNIQQSMWIMIYSDENYEILNKLSQDIESDNGTSFLMECIFYDEKHEERIVLIYNEMRNDEYKEFISECKKYLKELEKEISIKKFTFAELEEEEEELQKLKSWQKKIENRDLFHSSLSFEANEFLIKINDSFEHYSEMVYKEHLKSV